VRARPGALWRPALVGIAGNLKGCTYVIDGPVGRCRNHDAGFAISSISGATLGLSSIAHSRCANSVARGSP
jgi:hypothetical protein